MKKTSKYGLVLVMVLTFVFGSTITVSAKPIDTGSNFFTITHNDILWQDDAGVFWDFYFSDYFNGIGDRLDIYGFDPVNETTIVDSEYFNPITSKINMRRGIATFTSLNFNLTFLFDINNGEYITSGTRRDGDLYYYYFGPATINGTITIEETTYIIDGTLNGNYNILINSTHYIEK